MVFNLKHFCLSFCFLLSQQKITLAQQFNFKPFSSKNGLIGSIVNAIFQDKQGFVWFGTQGSGISRFDGKIFQNINKSDGLISSEITFITQDHKNNLWIASTEGVSKYDGTTFTNYGPKQGLSKGVVYWIYEDDKNKMWFAIKGGGVNFFDGETFTKITTLDGLPSNDVYNIQQDNAGNYLFGSSKGIAKYDGKTITSFITTKEVGDKMFFSSFKDSKGAIWFGGYSGCGVVKYKNEKFEKFELPEELKEDFIGSITEDKKGNYWFATDHGALKYNPSFNKKPQKDTAFSLSEKFHLFTDKQGLAANITLAVCPDYEGNVWLGTQGGGASLFLNKSFTNYNEKDGLTNKTINCIYEVGPNKFLLGTDGNGVLLFEATTNAFQKINNNAQLNNNVFVYSMMKDTKQNIWVGTKDGVYVFRETLNNYSVIKKYTKIEGQDLFNITSIIEDKKGNIWIGSHGSGVFLVSGNTTKNYCKKTGFFSDEILTVFEDNNSNIWLGTLNEGAIKYDGATFSNFTIKKGLLERAVWSICEDEKGIMYFGTGGSGVIAFNGTLFKSFNTKSGLASNYNPAIAYDKRSNSLWIGNDKGINKLKINSALGIEKIQTFGEQDGFQGIEVNQNAIQIDSKGLIWFGSVNGLARYNREQDTENIAPPKIQITGIKLAYQEVDWRLYADSINPLTKLPINLRLNYINNNLTFEFQALTTDRQRYTFILEGQDKKWSPLSTNNTAVYSNISPGRTYKFKVKAINNSGIWSLEESCFTFKIKAPWWQTWWFRVFAVILIVFSFMLFLKWRIKKLRANEKILVKLVAQRTSQVEQEKKIVEEQKKEIEEKHKEIKDSINYAQRIQHALLASREILDCNLKNYFVFFKPKDVVSGDFYWAAKLRNNDFLLLTADSTGHGVPGAIMSMLNISCLNDAVKDGLLIPSDILDHTRGLIIKKLSNDGSEEGGKDGMDASLISFDSGGKKLSYAAANNPVCVVRGDQFINLKADRMPISKHEKDEVPFTHNELALENNDMVFTLTDGFQDQFGGPRSKKFMFKQLQNLLLKISPLPLPQQKSELESALTKWMGDTDQIDDICIIGVRITH
jgi:ligand-binding sensor domain-containing protein/serine phosphatase RsbU (regulator of sigma subunit)